MVEFYLLTFPRFPLRKKEHKSYFGKNRTHDFRTSRCAGYLLDHSGDEGWTGKMNISLSPFTSEDLTSRDGFGCIVPRQPAHVHTQAVSGAYLLRGFSRFPQRRSFKPPYAIGSVPSLSGHVIAYRWRSLPRLRRCSRMPERDEKDQGKDSPKQAGSCWFARPC